MTAPSGARFPCSTARPPLGKGGSPARRITSSSRNGTASMFSPRVLPLTVVRSRCRGSLIWASRAGRPPGVVEVLHQVLTAGPDVGQPRHARGTGGRSRPGSGHLAAAGHGDQVDDGVGGTAQGEDGRDRVLERLAGRRSCRGQVLARPSPRCATRWPPPSGSERSRPPGSTTTRQRHAESLGGRRHRRGGAHRHAVPGERAMPPRGSASSRLGYVPGAPFVPEAPHVRPAPHRLAAPVAP